MFVKFAFPFLNAIGVCKNLFTSNSQRMFTRSTLCIEDPKLVHAFITFSAERSVLYQCYMLIQHYFFPAEKPETGDCLSIISEEKNYEVDS